MSSRPKTSFLVQERRETAVFWTIQRPDRKNAIGPTIADQLNAALTTIESECKRWLSSKTNKTALKTRVLVLDAATQSAANQKKIWIAGGDLTELATLSKKAGHTYSQKMLRICQRLETLPIPVVICIDGAAIGGGAELALAGDIRIATASSSLDFKQMKVGLATGFGGTRRLTALVGLAHAQNLLLTSATVEAEQAHGLGLFHEVVADRAAAAKRLDAIISDLCALDPRTLWIQKKMLQNASGTNSTRIDAVEQSLFGKLWGQHAHQAFLKKWTSKN